MLQILHSRLRVCQSALCSAVSILIAVAIALQMAVAPAYATGVSDLPTLEAASPTWVIDQANVLSRLTQGNLNSQLQSLAETTGDEVRLVTIHRFDYGETAQSLVDKLFETWFPTPEDQANQVVVLLDNLTNTSAIRVGAALQSVLTPDIADSVAQETLQVPLRQGDKYNQALQDVSDRLVAVLSGQPDPGPPVFEVSVNTESTFTSAEDTDVGSATTLVLVLLAAATIIPMVTYYLYVR